MVEGVLAKESLTSHLKSIVIFCAMSLGVLFVWKILFNFVVLLNR